MATDGGPAFPVMAQRFGADVDDIQVLSLTKQGMSLRDYFAGQALMAMVSHYDFDDARGNESEAAVRCYEFADAMLKARA